MTTDYTEFLDWDALLLVGLPVKLQHADHVSVFGKIEGFSRKDGERRVRVHGALFEESHGWTVRVKAVLPPEPATGTTYVAMGGRMPITRGIGALHFRAGWDDDELGGKTWREVVAWHQESIDDPNDDTVGPFRIEVLLTKSQWQAEPPQLEVKFAAYNIINQLGDLWSDLIPSPDWVAVRQSTNDQADKFVAEIIRSVIPKGSKP